MQIDELFGHLFTHELRVEQVATSIDISANLAPRTLNNNGCGKFSFGIHSRGQHRGRACGRGNPNPSFFLAHKSGSS